MPRSSLSDWLKLRIITAYRKDNSAHADRLRRLPVGRRRRPGDLQATTSSARNCSSSSTRARCRAWSASIISTPTPSTSSTCGSTPPARRAARPHRLDLRRRRHQDLGGVRRLHLRFHRRSGASRSAAATPATSATRACSAQNLILGGSPELGGSSGSAIGTPVRRTDLELHRQPHGHSVHAARLGQLQAERRTTIIYVSYSQGFKGGGFDPRGLTTRRAPDADGTPPTASRSTTSWRSIRRTVDSYELGWKASLFDRRLQLAVASSTPNITTSRCRARSARVDQRRRRPSAASPPMPARRASRASRSRPTARVAQRLRDRRRPAELRRDARLSRRQISRVHHQYRRGHRRRSTSADFRKIQNTPQWTLSGTLDYDTPVAGGRLNLNTTALLPQQEPAVRDCASPMLDQPGFALWDANLVWRSSGDRWTIGLHGKNLTNKNYIVVGLQFPRRRTRTPATSSATR